jgi:hypothetical protein
VIDEANADGRCRLYRDSAAGAERELATATPAAGKMRFSDIARPGRRVAWHSRVRFTTSHPRDFTKDIIDAIDALRSAITCICRCRAARRGCSQFDVPAEYTREQYLERIAWIKAARNKEISHHHRRDRRLPGRNRSRIWRDAHLLDEVGYDGVFSFKYSPRPNTPSLQVHRLDSRRRKITPSPRSCKNASARFNEPVMPGI